MKAMSPEEMMQEFKQYLKKTRLDEQKKNKNEKDAMVMKQIKKLIEQPK